MPIDKSWGEEEKLEYVAQITNLRLETDTFEDDSGVEQEVERIYIDLSDVDPTVLSRFPLRFRASKHRNASWMKWLNAIEYAGFKCKDDPNDLVSNFVHIREETDSGEINGEYREWVFPRPVALLTTEEAAKEVFETLPKAEAVGLQLDPDKQIEFTKLYGNVEGNKEMFVNVAGSSEGFLPEGISAEEAYAIAKASVE